jgi:membrane associated rhomboid family serine protease
MNVIQSHTCTQMSQDTLHFVTGTLLLSCPSLISLYYQDIGLKQPLLSKSFLGKHLTLTYRTIGPSRLQLLSPPHTLVTYMFNHYDLNHFLGNFYSIASSAYVLDLGLWKSAFIFVGGGIAGALSHMLEALYTRTRPIVIQVAEVSPVVQTVKDYILDPLMMRFSHSPLLQWIDSQLIVPTLQIQKPQVQIFSLVGSSAGAYALMGAELYMILSELARIIILMGRVKSRTHVYNEIKRMQLYTRFWTLLITSAIQLVTVYTQVMSIQSNNFSTFSDLLKSLLYPKILIGHSAHVGGFLFGFICMYFIKRKENRFRLI